MCTRSFLDPFARFPLLRWIRTYNLSMLLRDFIAGITVALTVIPQGMAYASVAGLPEVYGLYSSFVGPIVYMFLGTSKDITMGPTAVMSLIVSAYASSVYPQYAVLLTFCSGVVQILISVFQLGFLLNYVSHPVIAGFTSGAALLIAYGQVKDLTGIPITESHLIPQIIETFKLIKEINFADLLMGVICLLALLILRRLKSVVLFPSVEQDNKLVFVIRKFVWLICTASNAIVVIAATIFVYVATQCNVLPNLTLVGKIKSGFPPVRLPPFGFTSNGTEVSFTTMASEIGSGFIIVPLLGILESIAIAKSFGRKNNYRIDATQEILAIGTANVASSFFQSYPITGSFSRTAVNSQSNVATPLGGIFTSIVVINSLIFLAPAFQFIPKPSLAALIIASIIFNFDYALFPVLWRIKKTDLLAMTFTVVMCCLTSAEYGIISGIGISLLISLWPLARPRLQSQLCSQGKVRVVKFGHGLAFPAAETVLDSFSDFMIEYKKNDIFPECCVINLGDVWQIDMSVIISFSEVTKEMHKENVRVYFVRGSNAVLQTILRANKEFPDFKHFTSYEEAIAANSAAEASFSVSDAESSGMEVKVEGPGPHKFQPVNQDESAINV